MVSSQIGIEVLGEVFQIGYALPALVDYRRLGGTAPKQGKTENKADMAEKLAWHGNLPLGTGMS